MRPQYQPAPSMQYPAPQPQPQQPSGGQSIIWVPNEKAANEFIVAPNNAVTLWDMNAPVVYVKKADAPAAEADGDEEDKGTKVELGEDGVYTVILDSDMTITAGDEAKNGVESVAVATTPAAGNSDVYTVTGMLVLRNATPAQLKALPAGIYIVGGAKYVRK